MLLNQIGELHDRLRAKRALAGDSSWGSPLRSPHRLDLKAREPLAPPDQRNDVAPLVNDLYSVVDGLLGRPPEDAELQSFLEALGHWPLTLGPEDILRYLAHQDRGFCLLFMDASGHPHPVARGKPPRTPIFKGCFFYAEGVEECRAFAGALPNGITWSDTATTLLAKLGPPKNAIISRKRGVLTSHFWTMGQ